VLLCSRFSASSCLGKIEVIILLQL